jgi:hypothetical protein
MNPDRQQALEYLRAPANGFWRWAEQGNVLVWRDGGTLAFREEIVQIVGCLAPGGLPPFGAVVFLLAACRGKLPAVDEITSPANVASASATGRDAARDAALLQGARRQLRVQLEAAVSELAKVARLPAELNSGIKAKCVLAETVFEPAKVERQADGRAILRGMAGPMSDEELTDPELADATGRYIRQIHIVAEGLKPQTVESLKLRLGTGLETLPSPAEVVDLPLAERARRLIDELSRDRDLGGVARAARELLAAVRLPRRLGEREQLALSGVADITNRGPLDRLLLSELAHDDLTLSVRVALNEALYLRREPPMREPPGTLALLIDSGIRLWGTPRVLAAAVALALIVRGKQHQEVRAWRASGGGLEPLDLLSRAGLTQHLGSLEPRAHPADALPAFADAVSKFPQIQSVIITHPDTLADREFRRALAGYTGPADYVATVDRDGRFELHALPLAHRQPLCEADLDLGAILDERAAVVPTRMEADPNLPAIFGMVPFPFLMTLTGNVSCRTKGPDASSYAVMEDRRLVQFGDQQSGARILASDLPPGPTLWMECDGRDLHLVRGGSRQRPTRLLSLALPHGQLRVADLASGPEVLAAHRYGDAIVLMRQTDLRAYALADGRLLGALPNPHRWVRGRYFRGTRHFYFAVWDGERLGFQPVSLPVSCAAASVVTIFERDGLAGPWILSESGEVASTESGQTIKLPIPKEERLNFAGARISRDGHRLVVPWVPGVPRADGGRFYDLEKEPQFIPCRPSAVNLERNPGFPTWNIYRSIESVAAGEGGVLMGTRKNRWWRLVLEGDAKMRILHQPAAEIGGRNVQSFPAQRPKTRYGCTLCSVQLANGAKVFLDSRGLLHFKSQNPDVPEVSVILSDGEVAGWTSDGCVCGPRFFFDGPYSPDPPAVYQRLLKIFSQP